MTETDGGTPVVSAVIATYNDGHMASEAIDSALAQTYAHVEVIVVDDGSDDDTPLVLARYADDSRVHVFRQDNAGPAAARNKALRYAHGEYIAFLDADDLWLPHKTEKQLEVFRQHAGLGLVYSRRRGKVLNEQGEWMDDEERNRLYTTSHYDRGRVFREMTERGGVGLSSAMVPKRVLDEVGGFDEELITAEDRHLYARIAHDYPFDFVEDVLVIKRRHSGNISWDPDREPQTLEFLRKIAAAFPECSLESSDWMRRLYADAARESGYDALEAGRMAQARREFWEACRYRPGRLSNWAYLAAVVLPGPLVRLVRRVRRRLRG